VPNGWLSGVGAGWPLSLDDGDGPNVRCSRLFALSWSSTSDHQSVDRIIDPSQPFKEMVIGVLEEIDGRVVERKQNPPHRERYARLT
jgi:hypothetical protein